LTEDFVVVCLNYAHQVIGWVKVSSGGCSRAVVEPRVIFAVALLTGSAALVLAHNHPSGDVSPSEEDKLLTRTLVEAAKLLNLRILDHIILGKESSFSFGESGLI
jgi:DNA repair protein RadC